MYGGSDFDGNAVFAGGDFMPSQATTQSHDSSSSSKQRENETRNMYGGGDSDGNAVFAGGGLMSSRATTQSQDSSSSSKNGDVPTLLPLTLKQLNSVLTNGESNFSIDGVDINSVAIVGRVSRMDNRITQVKFVVDDSTGCVECVRWCHQRQEAEEMEAVKLGMYVRLHGHLKSFQGKLSVNVFSVRPVTDFNEILYHFTECISVHTYNTKSKQLENAITQIPEENNNKLSSTSETRSAEAKPLVASSSLNRKESSDVENETCYDESKVTEATTESSELEMRLKELEILKSILEQERLSFVKERESHEANFHKQREYLHELEKELREKEESMLRTRKSRVRDGAPFADQTIPARSTALRNLPAKFHGAYNKLSVEKLKTYLEAWVWEAAEHSNRVGVFYLSDDRTFTHLSWKIHEPFVSHRKEWIKLAGPVRDQHGHPICWGYVGSDLVSIKRVIRGWDEEYVPLCTWFLSYFAPSDDPRKLGHRCSTNSVKDGLNFIQSNGVPLEIPEHQVFDCKERPPSADKPKFKIKSVITIDTIEEALEVLKTEPIGASLVVFSDLLSPGKKIYYGPKAKNAKFLGFHSVVMIGVRQMDGELVVVCKLSNGKRSADNGYAYVSLSVMYMVVAAIPEEEDRHRATPTPQPLLSCFVYAEMDQAPPNLKRKNETDRKGASKKTRL